MFHQEITIPVNSDKRNFEERRKDMLSSLESSCTSNSSSTVTSKTSDNKSTAVVANKSGFMDSGDDLWDMECKQWLTKSRTGWDNEIARIKRSFFDLEPLESDDIWNRHGADSHSTATYTKKISTTTTTSTTKGGETTSETSQQFYSSTGGTGNKNNTAITNKIDSSNTNKALTMSNTDYLKDAYELSDDKHVHFKIRINTEGFKSGDIKVTAYDDRIEIKAKKESQTDTNESSREFSRTISVPPSVDIKKFQCHQTQDGILILEAPLKQEDTKTISIKDGLGTRATSDQHSTFSNALVTVTGKSGPLIIDDPTYGKKVHLEIPVDRDYLPSDFTVYTDLNKIHIKGRHETKTAMSSSSKEFSRYYEVPQTLDPMSVSFHLLDGTLVVEAPLLKMSQ